MSNYGGKREGAGRKAHTSDEKKVLVTIRLSQEMVAVIDQREGSRSEVIRQVLTNHLPA